MSITNPNADPYDYETHTPKSHPDTPLDENDPHTGEPTLWDFEGFTSGTPFLLERPSRYITRMRRSMNSLLVLPERDTQESIDSRILWSPIVELPIPLAQKDDTARTMAAVSYPFMYVPQNQPLTDNMDPERYALTLHVYLAATQAIVYDTQHIHDLYTYGVDASSFLVDDATWERAGMVADYYAGALRDLNIGRLTQFMLADMDNEYDAWDRLMLTWGIDVEDKQHPGEVSESIVVQLLDRGAQASTRMASMYDKVFDLSDTESGTVLPYNAFHENDTDGL